MALKSTKIDLLSGLGPRDQQALIRHSKQHGIVLYGLDETLAALKTIDPTLRKEARKRIRKVPAEVAKRTKAEVPSRRPMRNWGSWSRRGGVDRTGRTMYGDVGALTWDASAAKAGIKVLTGGQRLNVRLVNKSAVGSVFEMAGSRRDFSSPVGRGQQFTNNLNPWGPAPRLLVKTWREEKGITRTASEMGKVARFAEERVKERIR